MYWYETETESAEEAALFMEVRDKWQLMYGNDVPLSVDRNEPQQRVLALPPPNKTLDDFDPDDIPF